MSQQAGYSPSFKRPADIMRKRWRRSRSDAGVGSSPGGQRESAAGGRGQSGSSPAACVRPFSPGPLFGGRNLSGAGTKRRNPFSRIENTRSPKKRLSIFHDDDAVRTDEDVSTKRECRGVSSFSASLTEAERREHRDVSSEKCPPVSEDDSLFEEEEEEEEDVKSPLLKSPQAIAPASIAPPVCAEYPADWSLRTRLLFTSPRSLSWAEQPRAQEEALGLSQHCRARFAALPHSLQDPRSCAELRCAFQQSLVYWQHPSLPWVPLFPRINAERRFKGKSAPWAQDAALQQSLMSEWSSSLSSLYSLLKARQCPYFYLCSYQFTALFRAAGLAGSGAITALISPTTRGLREAMKAEGIEFSLPLVEERAKSREQQNPDGKSEGCCSEGAKCRGEDDEEEEEGGGDGDEEDSSFSWLKEMGVQDKIKTPDSISIQLRRESRTVAVDHKPESVARVEGPHTFTLINFLINCRSLVAAAGSQAGLPPTLLAPGAFRGATMHTLKARSVNVKTQVGSTFQDISSLEITGPILPSSLHAITSLLRPSQKGNFSAVLYTHAPTAVMNVRGAEQQGPGGAADVSGCGLHPASLRQLQQPPGLGKAALTHLSMSDYSYTWKS